MEKKEKIDQSPIDKSEWGQGPWQHELDRLEGEHAGLPTLALRGPMGTWCGYVAVPPGHPMHGKSSGGIVDELDVHGGITYANKCDGHRICHVPKPGEPADVWWLGFDCGHAFDIVPRLNEFSSRDYQRAGLEITYKDLAYVQAEIAKLADQLAAIRETR